MKNKKVRLITGCALLTATAVVLQYIEVPIPIMPQFIKLDFSDLPELIGAFAYGPVAGLLITLLKNIIHIAASSSVGVGELSNFILGAVFSVTAGLIYKRKKTKKNAFFAGFIASLVMAVISIATNYFVIYPMYYSIMGLPEPAILDMYQVIRPSTENIIQGLLIFNVPFTFVKGLICVALAMIIYKPLSKLLKGKTDNI